MASDTHYHDSIGILVYPDKEEVAASVAVTIALLCNL
jgi:hypothetical protein